jgi:SAM-dependent methyltransferase
LLAGAPWSPIETATQPTGAATRPPEAPAQPAPDPAVGQEGKDVPWVPTPDVLVDKMLEMAEVTADDLVIDLGSGDGRLVIAAARLGARAVGVELAPNLVALSERRAAEAGVSDRTEFVAADLFDFDLSPATVVTMFLLPDINYRLRPALFDLRPGTRIVSNTWDLRGSDTDPDAPGWAADATVVLDPCPTWCTSLLWIVPARVAGAWQMDAGELVLEQRFQELSGELRPPGGTVPISGRLRGEEISFEAGGVTYTGRVAGATMSGTARTPAGVIEWRAVRR